MIQPCMLKSKHSLLYPARYVGCKLDAVRSKDLRKNGFNGRRRSRDEKLNLAFCFVGVLWLTIKEMEKKDESTH